MPKMSVVKKPSVTTATAVKEVAEAKSVKSKVEKPVITQPKIAVTEKKPKVSAISDEPKAKKLRGPHEAPEGYVNGQELSRRLNVSPGAVSNWAKNGVIPADVIMRGDAPMRPKLFIKESYIPTLEAMDRSRGPGRRLRAYGEALLALLKIADKAAKEDPKVAKAVDKIRKEFASVIN